MDWRPISEAPKRGVILLASDNEIAHGWWDDIDPEYEGWVTHTISQWPSGMSSAPEYWAPLPPAPSPDMVE